MIQAPYKGCFYLQGSSEGFHAECLRRNDIEKRQPILEDKNILYKEPESPKGPLNTSSDKQALEHEKYEALTTPHLKYPEFDPQSRAPRDYNPHTITGPPLMNALSLCFKIHFI